MSLENLCNESWYIEKTTKLLELMSGEQQQPGNYLATPCL